MPNDLIMTRAFEGRHRNVVVVELKYDIEGSNGTIEVQRPLCLAGHLETVWRMSFSPDGRFLATTSHDRTLRMWDLQAAESRKRSSSSNTNSDDSWDIPGFTDETYIDPDGWAICRNGSEGGPLLRLMWLPEMHRGSLYRPSNVFVVGRGPKTRLDLGRFAHGEN